MFLLSFALVFIALISVKLPTFVINLKNDKKSTKKSKNKEENFLELINIFFLR